MSLWQASAQFFKAPLIFLHVLTFQDITFRYLFLEVLTTPLISHWSGVILGSSPYGIAKGPVFWQDLSRLRNKWLSFLQLLNQSSEMSESNFHLNSVLPFLFQIVSRDRIINIFCASNSLLPFHININSCFSLLFRNGLGRFLQNVNLLLRSHDFRQTRTLIIIHLLLGEMQVSAFILPEKQTFRAEPTNFLTFTLLSP